MGKRGHLSPPLTGNVVKCCALVVTAKRSVDELFMHYFHELLLTSGGIAPRSHQGSIPGLRWGHGPQTSNLPTRGKNPSGAYGQTDRQTERKADKRRVTDNFHDGDKILVIMLYCDYKVNIKTATCDFYWYFSNACRVFNKI